MVEREEAIAHRVDRFDALGRPRETLAQLGLHGGAAAHGFAAHGLAAHGLAAAISASPPSSPPPHAVRINTAVGASQVRRLISLSLSLSVSWLPRLGGAVDSENDKTREAVPGRTFPAGRTGAILVVEST